MFASKAQKEEKDYKYLADILKTSGMDTAEKIEAHLKKVMSRAFYATVAMLALIAALCLISPKYSPIWGIVGVMCFAWIWRSAIIARKIMHRYIKEEISTNNDVNVKEKSEDDIEK
ncbi:MAG: fatty acid desaturase [Cellvibrionaceae bacterium]|jgi:fatty acid desaturase